MAKAAAGRSKAGASLFLDASQPLARRVEDLVSKMTVPEKVSQLLHENPPIDRLGVPGYNWWNEGCHGVGRNGLATVFPQVIGLGGHLEPPSRRADRLGHLRRGARQV